MREIVIQFEGDDWNDEEEADGIEEEIQKALDARNIQYVDLHIK